MKEIKKRSDCPISSALDVFGDKWSLLIIRDIIFQGKSTYGDFLKSDEKIATNILADRLLLLELTGILVKEAHPDNKTKFVYKLTQKGIDLVPVLMEIIVWSDKYNEISSQARIMAQQARKDKQKLIKQISNSLISQLPVSKKIED